MRIFKMNWEGFTSITFNGFSPEVISKRVAKYSNATTLSVVHRREGLPQVHSYDERYLFEVRDVILDTKNGMLFSNSRAVIQESTPWPIHYVLISAVPRPPKVGISKLASGEYSFVCLTGNGFYHWLLEELPPFLFSLRHIENPKILLWEKAPKFVESILSILPFEVQRVPRFVALDRYFFVSFGQDSAWPHPEDVKILQREIQNVRPKKSERKIYVSRVQSTRSPEIEARLIESLRHLGWETVEMEGLGLLDQVKLLEDASVLCGVHGAGLSGMVWMPQDSLVLELTPEYFNPLFSRLAQVCGHRYEVLSYEGNPNLSLEDLIRTIESLANAE
jgi:hypothetical protein